MHVRELNEDGNHKTQSKMEAAEAMFIPACPMTPAEMDAATADIIFGDNNPFTTKFKYLGLYITHE
jgi:hypothetical protein